MKHLFFLSLLAMTIWACSNNGPTDNESNTGDDKKAEEAVDMEGKGYGEARNVKLNNPLNAEMVASGKAIYELKCAACHKLTDQRVVGPGWAKITEKRTPEWIMNMTTNIDEMLEKDPVARELLKECLVRMPNQNLTQKDARDVLEFIYANDGYPVAGAE